MSIVQNTVRFQSILDLLELVPLKKIFCTIVSWLTDELMILKVSTTRVFLFNEIIKYDNLKFSFDCSQEHHLENNSTLDRLLSNETCWDWFSGLKIMISTLKRRIFWSSGEVWRRSIIGIAQSRSMLDDSWVWKKLQVDVSTVQKLLGALGIIQKQGHWMPYELKSFTCMNCCFNDRNEIRMNTVPKTSFYPKFVQIISWYHENSFSWYCIH